MPRPTTTLNPPIQKSSAAPQTQDTELEELVPGRLVQTQWMEMLTVEQTEEAVAETMSHLLSQVMNACYRVDLKRQLTPFTATWVKDRIIEIVEQHFLCRDEGDRPEDILTEDSEPVPADPDAWAQGCVPLVIPSPLKPILPQEVDTCQKEAEPEVRPKCSMSPQTDIALKLPAKKTNFKPFDSHLNKLHKTVPPPKTELKKSTQGPIYSKAAKFLPPLSNSTESKSLKVENTTSFKNMSASIQSQSIQKLDPASLPDHCIFPKFEIVDSYSNSKQNKMREPKHRKQETNWTAQKDDTRPKSKHEGLVMTKPLRLDTMTLAKGVTLSNAIEVTQPSSSPKLTPPPVKLKPIRNDPEKLRFSVDQIVLDPHVQVTPVSQS